MSNAISQEIIDATTDGVKAIAMSLATQDQLTELSEFKKKLDKFNISLEIIKTDSYQTFFDKLFSKLCKANGSGVVC